MDPTTRPTTPPHIPIFGVAVKSTYVSEVITAAFPNHTLESITELPFGQSWNNRLYFLSVAPPSATAASASPPEPLKWVLKVNGRFFGHEKVQNEVSCLKLVEKYCKEVSAPRVVAWSLDGASITVPTSRETVTDGERTAKISSDGNSKQQPPWIIMTQLPGDRAASFSLDNRAMASVGSQLADIVASLRTNIPKARQCGNILFGPGRAAAEDAELLNKQRISTDEESSIDGLRIRGLLGDGIQLGDRESISSALELHATRLRDKLRLLQTEDVHRPNRELVPLITHFLTETLPTLDGEEVAKPGEEAESPFTFTHYDLSLGNTLIEAPDPSREDSLPRVTGIIDFEFSGFFPPPEEFVNDDVGNADDWPPAVRDAYLSRLEALGIRTPRKGIDARIWRRELLMGKLLDNIAPWWLPGGHAGEVLASKLAECAAVVRSTIRELGELGQEL